MAACFSVESIAIGTKYYKDGFMLVIPTTGSLTFIIPATGSRRWEIIEVPFKHISEFMSHGVDRIEQEQFRLRMQLNANGIVLQNGKQQNAQKSIICLISAEDLTSLWAKVRNVGNGSQTKPGGPAVRRSSSVLIHLDTGDEVTEKSDRYLESMSQVQGDVPHGDTPSSPVAHEATTDEKQGTGSRPETLPEVIADEKSVPADGNGPGSAAVSKGVHPKEGALQTQAHRDSTPVNGKADSRSVTQDIINAPGVSTSEREFEVPTESKELLEPNSKKHGKLPESKNQASAARKRKAPRPDTQESLLFRRPRRAKRKMYTGASNDDVDWDEDLRPSGDEVPEAKIDFDFTSVSSPGFSDNSALDRTVGTARKKRKPASSRKGGAAKKSTKKGSNPGNSRAKTPRLPLHPRESSADSEAKNTMPAQHDKSQNKERQGLPGEGDENHEFEGYSQHTSHSVVSTHESISPCKSGLSFGGLDLLSNASAHSGSIWNSSAAGVTQTGSDWDGEEDNGNHGRPDRESRQRAKKEGRGGKLAQKLATALLKADDFAQGDSLNGEGIGPKVLPSDSEPQKYPQASSIYKQARHTRKSELRNLEDDKEANIQQAESKSPNEKNVLVLSTPAKRGLKAYPGSQPSPKAKVVKSAQDDPGCEQETATIRPINRKRAACEDTRDDLPQKKHQAGNLEPNDELEPELEDPTTQPPQSKFHLTRAQDGTLHPENQNIGSSSWATTDETFDSEDTEVELHPEYTGIASSASTPSEHSTRGLKPIRKSIVDANGSPRLRSRQRVDIQQLGGMPDWQFQAPSSVDESKESDGHCSDGNTTECRPPHISTFRDKVLLYFGEDLVAPRTFVSSETESETSSAPSIEQPLSITKRLRASPMDDSPDRDTAVSVSTPVRNPNTLGSDQRSPDHLPALLVSSPGHPVHLESALAELDRAMGGDQIANQWQASLQGIQKTTDDILLNTNRVSSDQPPGSSNRDRTLCAISRMSRTPSTGCWSCIYRDVTEYWTGCPRRRRSELQDIGGR